MSELKPCPFCGKYDLQIVEVDIPTMHTHDRVYCQNCEDDYGSQLISRDTWNTRPIEDALRSENERLRIEVDLQYEHISELEEQTRWHPYPENKPEAGVCYEITMNACGYFVAFDYSYDGNSWINDKGIRYHDYCIIAYRPMPEAYKPEVEK